MTPCCGLGLVDDLKKGLVIRGQESRFRVVSSHNSG